MFISNHRIVVEDGAIVLKTNLIYIADDDQNPFSMQALQSLLALFQKTFSHPNTVLKREEVSDQSCFIDRDGKMVKARSSCVKYTLPSNPQHLLDFLVAYEMFSTERAYQHLRLIDFTIQDMLQKTAEGQFKFLHSVEELLKMGIPLAEKSGSLLFMEEIFKLASIPERYTNAITVLRTVYEYRKKLAEPNHNRTQLLYALERHALKHKTKDNDLFQLSHLISHFNLLAIVQLYGKSIGKKADDEGSYTFMYTEWNLLRDAQFIFNLDGKLAIPLKSNKGYASSYAENKTNHAIMEREFRHLAPLLGVEFDASTRYHDELVFSLASTQELMKKGLHLTVSYCKKLLRTQNNHHYFRQFRQPTQMTLEGQVVNNALNLLKLPRELFDSIFNIAFSIDSRALANEEVRAVKDMVLNMKTTPYLSLFPANPVPLKLEMQEEEQIVAVRPAS